MVVTWFESHWTGTQYLFNGRPVGDDVALMVVLLAALMQAGLYVAAWATAERLAKRQGASSS